MALGRFDELDSAFTALKSLAALLRFDSNSGISAPSTVK